MGSLTRLVGYLGWLVGCYYALLVGLRLSKSSWAKYFPGLRSSTEKSELELEQAREVKNRLLEQIQHDRHRGRPPGYARLFGTFLSIIIVSWTLMGVLAVQNHEKIKSQAAEIHDLQELLTKYDIGTVREHHVSVIAYLGKNEGYDEWSMQSDELGRFVYRACNDFNNAAIIRPGFTARQAAWEERGECKSIRRDGLGFFYRDENLTYMRVP